MLSKQITWMCLLISFVMLSSCSKNEQSQSQQLKATFADSTMVAMVNGEVIHTSEVEKAIKQFLNQLGKAPDQFNIQKPDSSLWKEALNWLVSMRILAQEARHQNIKVDDNEVDMAVKTIKRRFPTEQKFFDALKEAELSMEQFTNNLTNELMVQKLLDQKIGSKIEDPSDEDLLKYYDEHGDKFMQAPQIRVHHILIKVSETANQARVNSAEEKARRILEKIKKGEDFEKLARQYSEDPSALKGGDVGFFARGDMIKNFEDVAFALQPGEISDVVRTLLGFHIIRLDEVKPSQKIPFNELKTSIKLQLKQERSNSLFENYMEELKSKAKIQVRDFVAWK